MIKTFIQEQERAIEEKVQQLKKVRNGSLSSKELADMITERISPYHNCCLELLEVK